MSFFVDDMVSIFVGEMVSFSIDCFIAAVGSMVIYHAYGKFLETRNLVPCLRSLCQIFVDVLDF